jgi:GT2 family glycosyltransferase
MISVIIVNYNGRRFLDPCLSSLRTQSTTQDFETILVDNASSDDSVDFVRKYFPETKIIENKTNLGFAGGINEGIRTARGDYILTLNNDIILEPGFIESLTGPMKNNDSTGMCAGKMLFPDGRINSAGICISRSGAAWDRGMFQEDTGQFDAPEEVFGPCGGAALYRKKMLDEIGLFDEDFFLFMEDVDLAFRARLAGWNCRYVPMARAIHFHGGTAGYNSKISVYYGNRNVLWYVVKNFPKRTLIMYSPWIIGRNIGIIPYYILKGKGLTIIRSKLNAIIGIRRMFRKRNGTNNNFSEPEIRHWIYPWAVFRS